MTLNNGSSEVYVQRAKASAVFTPSAPINRLSLFRGRLSQISSVIESLGQDGSHPIIYGERGVGKTSLASVLHEILDNARMVGFRFCRINCDAMDTFDSLWQKVFKSLTVTEAGHVLPAKQELDMPTTLAEWVGEEMTPDLVLRTTALIKAHLVVILDEFDQLKDKPDEVRLIANTIKAASDQHSPLTIVLVGVADTIDELITQHESIDRNLRQIQIPRMSVKEVGEIVQGGMTTLGLSVDENALTYVCELVQGLPAAAHHIGLQMAYLLIDSKRTVSTTEDVSIALEHVIKGMGQTLLNDWNQSTSSPRKDALWKHVLLACALTQRNELGWFRPVDLAQPFQVVCKNPAYGVGTYSQHLHELATRRGQVLERQGSLHRYEFRFRKPLFQTYVLMRAITSGLLAEDNLATFKVNLPAQT